jgi:hypothetical protein
MVHSVRSLPELSSIELESPRFPNIFHIFLYYLIVSQKQGDSAKYSDVCRARFLKYCDGIATGKVASSSTVAIFSSKETQFRTTEFNSFKYASKSDNKELGLYQGILTGVSNEAAQDFRIRES